MMIRNSFGAALGFAAVILHGVPASAAPHDGAWSVLIVTERGGCDSYRFAVAIRDGKVTLAESAPVSLSGRVTARGAVSVNIRRGNQRADGSGRLSSNSGAGSWRGASDNANCAGRWTAEKR